MIKDLKATYKICLLVMALCGASLVQGQSKKQLREFQYIVENTISQGDDKKPLCALGFDWTQQQPNMILPMKIETSRDLQSWSTLSRKETISKLNYGDSQLIKSMVEIRCTTAKYLRVQWLQPAQSVQLHKISGRYQQAGSKKMQWESLGQPTVGKQGEWLFENPSVAPFERLQLKAPTNGLLYKGKLFAKNDQMSKWVKQQDIVQYRLKIDETELHSDAVNVNGRYRYWKVVLDSGTQFNRQQLPEIEVSRQQQQLVYLAQGAEPFVLVYGNADIKPVNNSGIKQLVIALKEAGAAPEMVMLGSSVAVTDKAEIEKKIPWKTMALWGILLVGTGLMGYMAHSLYRQMNK